MTKGGKQVGKMIFERICMKESYLHERVKVKTRTGEETWRQLQILDYGIHM